MAMKDCATAEMKRIQRKYINENGTQKRGMLAEGPDAHKHLTSDELFEISNALRVEPKIGRLANDRKRANELIAMPRGLLHVLLDELGYLIYCEEHREEIAEGMRPTRAPLEAQEPQTARLVTEEDFRSPLAGDGTGIPCWKESRSPTRRSGWAVIVYGKWLADKPYARYWTSRQTDEQRRDTPWE